MTKKRVARNGPRGLHFFVNLENAGSTAKNKENTNDEAPNHTEGFFYHWHLRAAAERRSTTRTGLHWHPPDREGRHRRSRANDGICHRYSFRSDDGSARLCADRNHARRKERAQVEGEIRQRRA